MSLKVFNKEKALELVDNDSELLQILLQTFIETQFSVEELEKLVKNGKLEEAASYTHRVKGAGRQLAMEKLAFSGQQLEDVLRKKAAGDLQILIDQFNKDYIEGLSQIKLEIENC